MTYCTQYTLHMTPAQQRHDKSAPLVTMGHMAQYYALGWTECTSMKGVCAVCSAGQAEEISLYSRYLRVWWPASESPPQRWRD